LTVDEKQLINVILPSYLEDMLISRPWEISLVVGNTSLKNNEEKN